MLSKCRQAIKKAKNLYEYIKAYKELWKHSMDVSPYEIQRTTEERMIKELEKLNKSEV